MISARKRGAFQDWPLALGKTKLPFALVGLSLAYFAAARIGIATSLPPEGIVILWPANAVVLLALLALGLQRWPAILAVTLATEIIADVPDYPLWAAAGYGLVNFSEAALTAFILSRIGRQHLPLRSLGGFLRFMLAGPVVAAGIAALGGAAIYKLGSPEVVDYLHYWRVFWFGDAIGLLIVGTGLISLSHPLPRDGRSTMLALAEAALVMAGLAAAAGWAFFGRPGTPSVYLVFPFLLWAALRFGTSGATVSLLITVGAAIAAAKAQLGPFAELSQIDNVIYLQGLIAVAGLSTFVLAFSVEDIRRRSEQLRHEIDRHVGTQKELQKAYGRVEEYNRELDRMVAHRTSELEESVDRNRFLLQELHHRVKNNLQTIASLISAQSRDTTAAELAEKLRRQITAMAATYDVLHRLEDSGAVDFCQVADELCQGLRDLGGGAVSFHIAAETRCVLPPQKAVGLALALNELITNAAKHAAPSPDAEAAVSVRCARQGEDVVVTVADTGPGFPTDFDPRASTGFGLRMARMMADHAGAELRFGGCARGGVVELRIPAGSTA